MHCWWWCAEMWPLLDGIWVSIPALHPKTQHSDCLDIVHHACLDGCTHNATVQSMHTISAYNLRRPCNDLEHKHITIKELCKAIQGPSKGYAKLCRVLQRALWGYWGPFKGQCKAMGLYRARLKGYVRTFGAFAFDRQSNYKDLRSSLKEFRTWCL